MRMLLLLVAFAVVLSGCAVPMMQPSREPTSQDEVAYLARVLASPVEFTLPAEDSEEAWGRAHGFVGEYSVAKIQVATDYVLQTYYPQLSDPRQRIGYGYFLTRTPVEDGFWFSTLCVSAGGGFDTRRLLRERNRLVFAHYVRTGELIPKFIE